MFILWQHKIWCTWYDKDNCNIFWLQTCIYITKINIFTTSIMLSKIIHFNRNTEKTTCFLLFLHAQPSYKQWQHTNYKFSVSHMHYHELNCELFCTYKKLTLQICMEYPLIINITHSIAFTVENEKHNYHKILCFPVNHIWVNKKMCFLTFLSNTIKLPFFGCF